MDGSGIDCVLHSKEEKEELGRGGNNKCTETPSSILHFPECQDENFMMRKGRHPDGQNKLRSPLPGTQL